jgi:cation diffusion facilitator CzcD-associated flavoprotein CzcO
MADYLAAYARRLRLDVLTNVEVRRVARDGDGRWSAETSAGAFSARACVVATGANRLPRVPPIPGRELFRGPLVHSGSVRDARELGQGHVIVVGLGNSGGDLAAALAASGARVSIATGRSSPVLPLRVAGVTWRTASLVVPGLLCSVARRLGAERAARRASASLWAAVQERHAGDLRAFGLRLSSREELADPITWSSPPFTSEAVLSAIRRGEIRLLPRLAALGERTAVLEGGGTVDVDAVLLATGFRHGLEEILPGLVAGDAKPVDGELEGAPGLFLCGFAPELRQIARAARAVARDVERALR